MGNVMIAPSGWAIFQKRPFDAHYRHKLPSPVCCCENSRAIKEPCGCNTCSRVLHCFSGAPKRGRLVAVRDWS
jgi:hypothetical protein